MGCRTLAGSRGYPGRLSPDAHVSEVLGGRGKLDVLPLIGPYLFFQAALGPNAIVIGNHAEFTANMGLQNGSLAWNAKM